MSKKDFANKLAAGMRRAKQSPAPRAVAPAATVRAGTGVKPRRARQNAPSPRSNLGPWRDLHPERIWPD